ncbi:OmpH family outer membrane protein [Paracidobacterium acidisoli]|nr:OmpH family outer membrane protein [Paracidobacterium acidisoli]MBT9332284.1 OmpH family outer membrane protein [Paracidobacterium acidisoli]
MSALAQAPADPAPAAAAASPSGTTKIAVIEFQAAVMRTNEGQRNFSELQKKYQPKQQAINQQNLEVENLKKQLQTAGDKLSDQERASQLKSIDEKEKDLQRLVEDTKNDYQSEMGDTFNQLAQKVGEVATTYAQQNGFGLLIDAGTQQSGVLWASPTSDITQAVITAYNAKSGVPAPASVPSAPTPQHTPAAHTGATGAHTTASH